MCAGNCWWVDTFVVCSVEVEGDPNVKKATHTTLPTPAALARESKRSSHWKKKSVGEAVESVPKGGGAQEEVFIGKAESVMVEEDSRREEAAVITINRQAEMEDEERVGVVFVLWWNVRTCVRTGMVGRAK